MKDPSLRDFVRESKRASHPSKQATQQSVSQPSSLIAIQQAKFALAKASPPISLAHFDASDLSARFLQLGPFELALADSGRTMRSEWDPHPRRDQGSEVIALANAYEHQQW